MTVGVVIVNYNCAPFAFDAALSALGDSDGNASVVIVDNASNDDSLALFQNMLGAGGEHRPACAAPGVTFSTMSVVSHQILTENQTPPTSDAKLTVIAAKKNGGFAAGCNIGMRFLLAQRRSELIILLNPDAVLAKGSIAAIQSRLSEPNTGLCGVTVLRHEAPHVAQAFAGAHLNPVTLLGDNLGAGLLRDEAPEVETVEGRLSYPLGAAMACRRDFIETVGFLDERYFLYYEEADWARAGKHLYKTVWARDAVVFHRHGAAAGSRLSDGGRSPVSDYHMARSRILYAIKWRPLLTPLMVLAGVLQAFRRLLRGRSRQARAVFLGSLPGAPRETV